MIRNVKIVSTGCFLPPHAVTSAEIDQRLGLPAGYAESKSGVKVRYHVKGETSSQMGAEAARRALAAANLTLNDIDLILCTSGTAEQAIPCTAVLIHKHLGCKQIPAFDINSTCLSFATGLDQIADSITVGRYKRVLIVATEASSAAINWDERESAILIGDGAVAVIVEKTPEGQGSKILTSRLETYSEGSELVEFRGCGTKMMSSPNVNVQDSQYKFKMDGRGVFKMASELLPGFCERLFEPLKMKVSDISLMIPHQASAMAMHLVRDRLNLRPEQMFTNLETCGNMVAASIPKALHDAVAEGRVKRGDKILLLGTAAGLGLGGLILEY